MKLRRVFLPFQKQHLLNVKVHHETGERPLRKPLTTDQCNYRNSTMGICTYKYSLQNTASSVVCQLLGTSDSSSCMSLRERSPGVLYPARTACRQQLALKKLVWRAHVEVRSRLHPAPETRWSHEVLLNTSHSAFLIKICREKRRNQL